MKKYNTIILSIIYLILWFVNSWYTDEWGNCVMPEQYKKISQDGEIHIYQNNNEGFLLGV